MRYFVAVLLFQRRRLQQFRCREKCVSVQPCSADEPENVVKRSPKLHRAAAYYYYYYYYYQWNNLALYS